MLNTLWGVWCDRDQICTSFFFLITFVFYIHYYYLKIHLKCLVTYKWHFFLNQKLYWHLRCLSTIIGNEGWYLCLKMQNCYILYYILLFTFTQIVNQTKWMTFLLFSLSQIKNKNTPKAFINSDQKILM